MTETFKKDDFVQEKSQEKASMPRVCVLTRLFGFL